MMRRVCVFCGSNYGTRDSYREMAATLGRSLAARGIGLVYGGSKVGLMKTLADAVLTLDGEVIGVMPEHLVRQEVLHPALSDVRIVRSMHERKAVMAELADAFIALPGGYGTLDELCEALSWSQLGLHRKACGLLNVEAFFDGLLRLLDRAVEEGFLRREHRDLLLVDTDGDRLIDRLASYEPAEVEKWVDRGK